MKEKILAKLNEIEEKNDINIIYAAESGSRGWGFASKDSDYDVRFIYIHEPSWYLKIDQAKDHIENSQGLLDLVGWDTVKTLKLFKKSNPPLFEWLSSPVIYIEKGNSIKKLKSLMSRYYSPKSCLFHYLSMVKHTKKAYLDKNEIKLKKYFYAIRPILACMWIEKFNTMPPMEFNKLLSVQHLDGKLSDRIYLLLKSKIKGDELNVGNKIVAIDKFIKEKIYYFEDYAVKLNNSKSPGNKILNELFLEMLSEYWNYDLS